MTHLKKDFAQLTMESYQWVEPAVEPVVDVAADCRDVADEPTPAVEATVVATTVVAGTVLAATVEAAVDGAVVAAVIEKTS